MSNDTFIFDTSVLLHDPEALHHFPSHQIILPGVVLEDLDRKKHLSDEMGRHARETMRFIDNMAKKGDISKGILLSNGSLLKVLLDKEQKSGKYQGSFCPDRSRNRLLASSFALKETGINVKLISKDPITKILAETMGIITEAYKPIRENFDTLHKGIHYIDTPKLVIDQFYLNGELPLPNKEFYPGDYCVLRSEENSSAICKVDAKRKLLVPLLKSQDLWGVKPKNVEQKCAMDLLIRDDVKLVSLVGKAGTGKTLLALAAGLRKVFDEGVYNKIIVTRSIMPLGRDIGFLPGTKEEKLRSWLAPFFDNLEYICGTSKNADVAQETKNWILESDKFQLEAITYMRGRSFTDTYIIIDEAQNLTPHELKTLISRVGENTKIIVLGDPSQIDNPFLDADSNGLIYLIGRMKKYDLFGSIYFQKTERSPLAAIAAEAL